MKKISKLESRS